MNQQIINKLRSISALSASLADDLQENKLWPSDIKRRLILLTEELTNLNQLVKNKENDY